MSAFFKNVGLEQIGQESCQWLCAPAVVARDWAKPQRSLVNVVRANCGFRVYISTTGNGQVTRLIPGCELDARVESS